MLKDPRVRPELYALMALIAALAWIGGSDTWRFLYWGAPVVFMSAGRVIEAVTPRRVLAPLLVLAAFQLLSARALLVTPDSVPTEARAIPVLTPLRATWNKQLVAVNPDRKLAFLAVVQYLSVTAALAFWLRRKLNASLTSS